MSFFTKIYRLLTHRAKVKRDFKNAINRLLSSTELTNKEKLLLGKISHHIHYDDGMYVGNAFHYISVGLSASRCIYKALDSTGKECLVNTILDFPCGYGRVLRFLRVMFPDANISCAEIDKSALDFCHKTFFTNPIKSKTTFNDINLPEKFDLIWCGSLFTHINEEAASNLLRFFYNHLSDNGLCVFTTHGQMSIDFIQNKKHTYGLTEDAHQKLIQEFQAEGYGYVDYPFQPGYGISVVSHQRMLELAKDAGNWDETLFLEHGWDKHQDVYAFLKRM
jgi:SAM-dependent methyltransferase